MLVIGILGIGAYAVKQMFFNEPAPIAIELEDTPVETETESTEEAATAPATTTTTTTPAAATVGDGFYVIAQWGIKGEATKYSVQYEIARMGNGHEEAAFTSNEVSADCKLQPIAYAERYTNNYVINGQERSLDKASSYVGRTINELYSSYTGRDTWQILGDYYFHFQYPINPCDALSKDIGDSFISSMIAGFQAE